MPRVFLSHSRRDIGLASGIARELRKLCVEPFDVFEDLAAGQDFRQTVKDAIRRADGFVLVVGAPEVTASSWAGYELGIAETLGKPVLVLLSHNRVASELPVDMSDLPVIPFAPERPEQAAREIVDRPLLQPDGAGCTG